MKKLSVFLMVIMIIFLTGCGTSSEGTPQLTGTATTEMDDISELMAGTVLLQKTSYPLDIEQESSLFLLWKGYEAVTKSTISADEEIEALEKQIKDVFTKAQLTSIDDMNLTTDTLFTKLSEAGIDINEQTVEVTEESTDTTQMAMSGGNMPSGDGQMPSNGGGMQGSDMGMSGGGSSLSSEIGTSDVSQDAATTSGSLSNMTSRTTNTVLLSIVTQYLSGVVNS